MDDLDAWATLMVKNTFRRALMAVAGELILLAETMV